VGILNVGFFGLVIAVTLLALHGSVRLTFVGILCAALTVGMYASPLSAMVIILLISFIKLYMLFVHDVNLHKYKLFDFGRGW
jgi:solute carrier family 50 protein (sugar transporter)